MGREAKKRRLTERTDGEDQVREHKEGRVLRRRRVVFVLVVVVPVAFWVRVGFFHVEEFARDLAPSPRRHDKEDSNGRGLSRVEARMVT